MELLTAAALASDQIGRLQDVEVLADRLARHAQISTELAKRLAVALIEPIEQRPPTGIGKCLEHVVILICSHPAAFQHTQPNGCMSRQSRPATLPATHSAAPYRWAS